MRFFIIKVVDSQVLSVIYTLLFWSSYSPCALFLNSLFSFSPVYWSFAQRSMKPSVFLQSASSSYNKSALFLTFSHQGFELCLFTSGSLFLDPFKGSARSDPSPGSHQPGCCLMWQRLFGELNDGGGRETAKQIQQTSLGLSLTSSSQSLLITYNQVLVRWCFFQQRVDSLLNGVIHYWSSLGNSLSAWFKFSCQTPPCEVAGIRWLAQGHFSRVWTHILCPAAGI